MVALDSSEVSKVFMWNGRQFDVNNTLVIVKSNNSAVFRQQQATKWQSQSHGPRKEMEEHKSGGGVAGNTA